MEAELRKNTALMAAEAEATKKVQEYSDQFWTALGVFCGILSAAFLVLIGLIMAFNFDKESSFDKRKRIEAKATTAKDSDDGRDSEESSGHEDNDDRKTATQLKIEQQIKATQAKSSDLMKVAKLKWKATVKAGKKTDDNPPEAATIDREDEPIKKKDELLDPNKKK